MATFMDKAAAFAASRKQAMAKWAARRAAKKVRPKLAQPIQRVKAQAKPAGTATQPKGYQKAGATRQTGRAMFKVVWSPSAKLTDRIRLAGDVMRQTGARVSGLNLSKSTVTVPVNLMGRAKSMFGGSALVTRNE